MNLIQIGEFSLQSGLNTLQASHDDLAETKVSPALEATNSALPGSIYAEVSVTWSSRVDDELTAAAGSLQKLRDTIQKATNNIYRNDTDISQKMAVPTQIPSRLQNLLGPTP